MNNKNTGFTLVEILVALTILAITMGAYLSQLDSQITQTQSIRNRTLAHWAAQNHLANMRTEGRWPGLVNWGKHKTFLTTRSQSARLHIGTQPSPSLTRRVAVCGCADGGTR